MSECNDDTDELLIELARTMLARFPQLREPGLEPLGSGLMHQTFAVHDAQGEFVLQRVHPLFSHEIHQNIQAVTHHLAASGIPTPELVPTANGEIFALDFEDRCWRLLTRVSGETLDRCPTAAHAESASALIARVHSALETLDYSYRPLGLLLHDTDGHLLTLRRVLAQHDEHPLIREAGALAREIFSIADSWEPFDVLPKRPAHGDLKFNNVLFSIGSTHAHALIDLDTVGPLPLYAELGDAWRSWCNRRPDDCGSAELDLDIWRASARSYLDTTHLSLEPFELRSLAEAIERISIELAARFTADMLCESYFGWDRSRYARAGEHHCMRARAHLDLYRQARETRSERASFLGG